MVRRYTLVLDPDLEAGGYTVTVPALPGVVTQGATAAECRTRALEAIGLYLEHLTETGQPLPEERTQPQLLTVEVA